MFRNMVFNFVSVSWDTFFDTSIASSIYHYINNFSNFKSYFGKNNCYRFATCYSKSLRFKSILKIDFHKKSLVHCNFKNKLKKCTKPKTSQKWIVGIFLWPYYRVILCPFPVENVTKFNKLKKQDDSLRGFCVRSPNLRKDKKQNTR